MTCTRTCNEGSTPLHLAALKGSQGAVKALLKGYVSLKATTAPALVQARSTSTGTSKSSTASTNRPRCREYRLIIAAVLAQR